jgi:hypothetical protein
MRGTYAVLALGAVLASGTLVALNQDHADAACANKNDPKCQTKVQNLQQLAQAGRDRRPEEHRAADEHRPDEHRPDTHRPDEHHPDEHRPEEHRPEEHHPDEHRPDDAGARDHEPPPEGRDRVIITESPAHMLDELNNRISDVVHNINEAEGREREADRKIRESEDDMENARAHREAAEADKRAAAEDRARQVARFVALLEEALHGFRFAPGPGLDDRRDGHRDEHREPERRFPRPHEAPHHPHQVW